MTFVITHRKARIEHRCSDCGRIIRPGETYRRGVGFDGTAWTWKDCQHCDFVLHEFDISDGGEYNADFFYEWAHDPSGDIAEMRLQAGYRKKWKTAQGNLWPLV